ncbi:MAG: amidohydrolase family protein, partial [Gammaproteobacteria bacterium]
YMMRENMVGSLEKGKMADFVVLDRDLLTLPIDDIPQTKVLMTVVGGKTLSLLPSLASELNTNAIGPATWPSNPLETRFVFKGPPPAPEHMKDWFN